MSKSWQQVCSLFERSVKSICRQKSFNFRVIVVCHEKPKIKFNHPYVSYVEVSFDLPTDNISSKELDRTRKVATGLIAAKNFNPTHVMVVDADDCVSHRLAGFVDKNVKCKGWFIKRGYMYESGNSFAKIMRHSFDRSCGTSNIIKYDLFEVDKFNEEELVEEYYEKYQHREIIETLRKKGNFLKPLPFAGAIYIVNNGENFYYGHRKKNRKPRLSLKSRFLRTKALLDRRPLWMIKEDFGL
ncbi:MAG: hypothetical protein ACFB12_18425 [Leptolyngbyaceae cyanobacterium]